jgi:hypothetical protein
MQIAQLFVKSISRPINGVVKADELDESSIWQELDEFVITRELDGHFRRFFSNYCEAIDHPNDPNIAGRTGIWISGFFGCGKSHFLKVLSYLLKNDAHTHDAQSKRAVEFFDSKIKDAMVFGDIQRAVASNTDVILFNIDSKAVQDPSGKKTLLPVFLKVLNEMQGYSPDIPISLTWSDTSTARASWKHSATPSRRPAAWSGKRSETPINSTMTR